MNAVIDFHTHILPQLDDGSRSVEESIQMLRREAEQGVRRVIATPHFYANRSSPEQFFRERRQSEMRLREAMAAEPGLPEVSVGAEVHFFEGISDAACLAEMAIAGTECVLVEMPMSPWSDRNLRELADIRQKRNLTPIIAHMERYMNLLQPNRIPACLSELPVLIQVNASFFTRLMTRRTALRLLREEKIHLIGSDCHNLESRPPDMAAAIKIIERALGFEAIARINALESELMAAEA